MVLSDNEIKKLNMIEPFSEDSLQCESYDLAIGNRITVFKKEIRCIDLNDQKSADSIYEEKELPKSGYVLSPKEYVLLHLNEELSIPENITAHLRPRTRFTRLGLIVSGQHCNSAYVGKLKVGLFNASDYPVKIYPGIKIAQVVFEELSSIPSNQYGNKDNATYQNEDSFIGYVVPAELRNDVNDLLDNLF